MDQPSISRFNSQSTNKTLIGSIDSPVSPLFSTYKGDAGYAPNPIVHTPDNKQWIDLDVLSPKLVKELRRQYDPSIKDEPTGPLEKGAAKIKAFVRQTKQGIDIRLRRKINAEQEEVTDIQLVPHAQGHDFCDEKALSISELPASLNEISELPDTSITQELDAAPAPSRTSTGDSIGEPLPKYEPRRSASYPFITAIDGHGPRTASVRPPLRSHHQSASQSSIVLTPTRGLSLIDHEDEEIEDAVLSEHVCDVDSGTAVLFADVKTHHGDAEPPITESLQTILAALQEIQSVSQDRVDRPIVKPLIGESLGSFQVANTTTYETETEAEIVHSVFDEAANRPLKTDILPKRRRRKHAAYQNKTSNGLDLSSDSDEEHQAAPRGLLRMRTIPKRLTASSGAEALWLSLIKAQANLLGAENPLVYQARSDLAHSRASGHAKGSTDLASLERSHTKAADMLGSAHPRVQAFSEELRILQTLIGNSVEIVADERVNVEESTSRSHNNSEEKASEMQNDGLLASPVVEHSERLDRNASGSQTPEAQRSIAGQIPSSRITAAEVRPELPNIVTSLQPSNQQPSPSESTAAKSAPFDGTPDTWNSPQRPPNTYLVLPALACNAIAKSTLNTLQQLLVKYGPEPALDPGKVRVRWTCSCGEQLHDDFVEQRRGAARRLEVMLNGPRMHTAGNGSSSTSPSSSHPTNSFASSSFGFPPSSQTSWSSLGQGQSPVRGNIETKLSSASTMPPQYYPPYGPSWLLTCANDDRYTTKLEHLDMAHSKITSDKDLAKSLRQHYFNVNRRWWRSLRIRGLTTIEFVQLEVHSNRFADIRKCPDMPETPSVDYAFEPSDLLPPVGSAYLLHLFKHPEDYDSELIAYDRIPKRHVQLRLGVGWGINLVEGFLADRVWALVSIFFALGSVVFAIVWQLKENDLQAASGIAAWILSFSVLTFGWLQSFLG